MNYLIPMAGAGSRFTKEGYKTHKPAIPTTSWRTGEVLPMVVAAAQDLPHITPVAKIVFINREFHKQAGLDNTIKNFFPHAEFITINHLTQGQASSCLLAEKFIDNDQELLIAGCDNGMIFDTEKFDRARNHADMLVFTYRQHRSILSNPNAYGWVQVDNQDRATGVSVKKQISDNPLSDHAIVATFWFKKGHYFVQAAKKMIAENDLINNEFYVDQVIKHAIELKMRVNVFEIEKYLCWGTPTDYEEYEKTYKYWKSFRYKEVLGDKICLK